ncbi:MAG: PQQ-binding-like beta-propeller repeat protein [Bacteroidota bacterium]|nr:PQQ-binding-like beta-propeller repeat protein [Bacteroidota bacterium]
MKNKMILLATLFWVGLSLLNAQENFPEKWAAKFNLSPDNLKQYNPDGSLVVGANEEEICMLNGMDGKVLWSYEYKDKLGIKSFEYQSWNKKAGVIMLLENKDDNCHKIFLDEKTGNELWRTDRLTNFGNYLIDGTFRDNYVQELYATPFFDGKNVELVEIKTGKALWSNSQFKDFKDDDFELFTLAEEGLVGIMNADKFGYIDLKTGKSVARGKISPNSDAITLSEKDLRVSIDYGKHEFLSFTRKMTLSATKISTNQKVWETSFEGTVYESWAIFSGESVLGQLLKGGNKVITFDVVGDNVIVIYEGISVFDLKDGRKLWSAAYESVDYEGGLKVVQILNVAARLISGDGIFLVDRKTEKIHKYDLATGKELWTAPGISSDDIIPCMILKNHTLLVQFGGYMSVQTFFTGDQVYQSESKFAGDSYGIRAYNAETGSLLWDTDKMKSVLKEEFGERITDLIINGDYVYVCGEKTLFALEVQTGKPKYTVNIKDLKIDAPFYLTLSESGQRLYLDCDEGIAAFNIADGKKIYSNNTDKNFGRFSQGKNYFSWNGVEPLELSKFIGFDLNTGAIKGEYEMNSDTPQLTDDGEYLIRFDGKNVIKLSMNKK